MEPSALSFQSEVIHQIFGGLQSESSKGFILKGKSGSGKSFIAKKVGELWKLLHDENSVLVVEGDVTTSDRDYYSLTSQLSRINAGQQVSVLVTKSIAELAKGIPVAGDLVSFFIESLSNQKINTLKEEIRYLNETEKQLIFDLERIFKSKSILLIVDNLHWIDEHTVNFIDFLISRHWDDNHAVLKRLKFIGVVTEDQSHLNETKIKKILSSDRIATIQVETIKQEHYTQILASFGYTGNLKNNDAQFLYSLTGGHLALIKRLAEYLSLQLPEVKTGQIELPLLFDKTKISNELLIEQLLLNKLVELGVTGERIIELLEYAAVIGISFTYDELACVSNEKKDAIKSIITKANDNALLDNNSPKFSHELIRHFFLSR